MTKLLASSQSLTSKVSFDSELFHTQGELNVFRFVLAFSKSFIWQENPVPGAIFSFGYKFASYSDLANLYQYANGD